MLARDDVVDLEGEPVELLRDAAILAAAIGSLPYQFLQRAIHACLVRFAPHVRAAATFEGTAGLRLQDVNEVTDPFVVINRVLLIRG